jgi:hypothetical protein
MDSLRLGVSAFQKVTNAAPAYGSSHSSLPEKRQTAVHDSYHTIRGVFSSGELVE